MPSLLLLSSAKHTTAPIVSSGVGRLSRTLLQIRTSQQARSSSWACLCRLSTLCGAFQAANQAPVPVCSRPLAPRLQGVSYYIPCLTLATTSHEDTIAAAISPPCFRLLRASPLASAILNYPATILARYGSIIRGQGPDVRSLLLFFVLLTFFLSVVSWSVLWSILSVIAKQDAGIRPPGPAL